jgi:5-methylcytosine-specific restriction enzyme A
MTRPYHRRNKPYYDARWRRARVAFLTANPLCMECRRHDHPVRATEVDHVTPHRGDYKLFWDEDNWQALCHRHHSAKTMYQMAKSPRLRRGADVSGIPLDPLHPWNQR